MTDIVIYQPMHTVTVTAGAPTVMTGTPGMPGPPGPPGQSYVHVQSTPAAEWIVNHNLGFKPQIAVIDSGGAEIDAEILHVNVNQSRIYFTAATSGIARCN